MHKVNQNGAIARLRLPRNRHGKGINQENACAVGNDRNETARIARDLTIDQKLFEAPASAGKLNFIGNSEAKEALTGGCDVIVADGFSGNVMLKTIEGMGSFLGK